MPVGTFLDSIPSLLFISAHVMFLGVAAWAWRSSTNAKSKLARVFVLYGVSQLVFLGFFGGVITMKLAVLIEQTLLVVAMVLAAPRQESAPSPAGERRLQPQ